MMNLSRTDKSSSIKQALENIQDKDIQDIIIREDVMAYFLYQTALISTIAILAGTVIGWWLHHYYGKEKRQGVDSDLNLVKNYLAESIKESSRLKLQLKLAEEKVESLSTVKTNVIEGVDFEAYRAFEDTVKEAQLRKYLN